MSPSVSNSRQQIVERAEAFLSARTGEPVSIVQLCRIVGVSERSLRNAFYTVRGMSPKRCAVRARLAEVRQALSVANGMRGAVTAIATDYGFFELGRFARRYKAVFGESPSATLRGHGGADEPAGRSVMRRPFVSKDYRNTPKRMIAQATNTRAATRT
jgi:transcriptional regulator GlxA family with amidase domain